MKGIENRMLTEMIKKVTKQSEGLQNRTLKAAFWSLLGSGGRGAIRFASNLILTRILFPEAFGLMATAMVVLTLVQVFSDTGIKTALIQNPRGGEKAYINTSFIIALIRSAVLFIIVLLASQPAAAFYGEAELQPLLVIMAFALLAEGFINPALPLLIKSLRVEKQVSYAIGSQFAGFVTTLILAWSMQSVTALALGYFSTSLYRVFASYVVIPYLPRLKWDKQAGRELFNFGKFIILNTLITWAVLNIDRLIIGKVLDMEQLGYYNIALYLGVYVSEVLVQVFAQSYFPAVSSIASDIERVQKVYLKTVTTVISVAAPFMMLIVLFAHELVDLLYDPRYALAGSILVWISLKSYLHFISHLQSGTLTALGKPAYVTLVNGLGLVFLAAFMPMITRQFGLMGGGLSMLISTVLIGFVQSSIIVWKIRFDAWTILRPWLQLAFNGIIMTMIWLALKTAADEFGLAVISIIIMGLVAGTLTVVNLKGDQLFSINKPGMEQGR